MTFAVRFRTYQPGTDTKVGFLPDPTSFKANFVHNDDGALSLKYSQLADAGDVAATALETGLDVAFEVNWQDSPTGWIEPFNSRFLLVKRNTSPADESKMHELSLVSYSWLLSRVRNLNLSAVEGSKSSHSGQRKMSNKDAGDIMNTFLGEHEDRGHPIPIVRTSWTTGHDSAGVAWSTKRTLYYDVGQDIHAVLDNLADLDLCDWRFAGRNMRMYNADGICVDLSSTIFLTLGVDLGDAPSEESMEEYVRRILVKGSKKKKKTVTATSGPTIYGDWEGFIDDGGVDDTDDLEDDGNKEFDSKNRMRGTYDRNLTLAGDWLPFRDYNTGDWVTGPAIVNSQRMRVQEIIITRDNDVYGGSITLNDRVKDTELLRASKLASVAGGVQSVTGSGTSTDDQEPDVRQPSAPTGLAVTGELYVNPFGEHRVRGRFSWTATSTATDGTALEVSRYELLGQPQTTPTSEWRTMGATSSNATALTVDEFSVNSQWLFAVRAYGVTTTEPGGQSATVSITFGHDTMAPNAPSTPTATSYLGAGVIGWDGKDSSAGAMPTDFARCEVHLSTTSGFTPDLTGTTTRKAVFLRGGTVTLSGLAYGTAYYAKLVAYDLSGNASTPSAQASFTPQQAVSADMAQSAIDAIRDYTITAVTPSINGKNTISRGTSDPPGTYSGVAGDRWEKYSAGKMVGTWHWSGSSWVAEPLDPTYIPQIDIGAGTFGSLDGSRLSVRSVLASSMLISDFANLAAGSDFENATANPWTLGAGWALDTGAFHGGTTSLKYNSALGTGSCTLNRRIEVRVADQYYVEFWAIRDASWNGTAANSKLRIGNQAGSLVDSVDFAAASFSAGVWTKRSKVVTVPAGCTEFQVTLTRDGTAGSVYLDDVTIRRMNGGEMLIDGSILANKMSATDIFAIAQAWGPLAGTHLSADATGGFQAWNANPDAGGAIQSWLRMGTADTGDGMSGGYDPDHPVFRITAAGHMSAQSLSTQALRVAGDTLDTILSRLPQGRMAYAESTRPTTGISTTETGIVELRAVLQPGRTYSIAVENVAIQSSAGAVQVRQGLRYALAGASVSTSSTALRLNSTDYIHPSGVYLGQPDLNATLKTDTWGAAQEIRLLYTVWRYSGSGTVDVWGGSLQPLMLTIRDEGPAMAATTTAKLWTTTWNCSAMYRNGTGSAVTSVQVYDPGSVFAGTSVFAHGLFGGTGISGEAVTMASAMSGATLLKAEIGTYVSKSNNGDCGWYLYPSAATAATPTITDPPHVDASTDWQTPPSFAWHDVSTAWTTASRSIHLEDPNLVQRTLLNTTAHPLQARLTYLR